MKRIFIFFILFLLTIPVFSEPLTGFSGIKFGTDRESVKAEAKKQGWWTFYSDSESIDSYFCRENGNLEGYAFIKLDTIYLLFLS